MSAAQELALAETPAPRPSRYRSDQLIANRYRLVRPLADGDTAELWVAQHADLNSEVVLKFLQSDGSAADEEAMIAAEEQFKLEAQVTAQLAQKTKHIVAVIDWGTFDGAAFIVMEHVHGPTLEKEMRERGSVEPERAMVILEQIGEALSQAHREGIIHRDLKPSNVMLAGDGAELVVKVADFGVAKAKRTRLLIERPTEPKADHFLGSPVYASPEQLEGRDVDARSDLWSLGVVAYEALTGTLPFREGAMPVASRTFTPPSRLDPKLPRSLDAWFARALAADKADRFESADEMIASLRACLGPRRRSTRPRDAVLAIAAIAAPIAVFLALRSVEPRPPPEVASPEPPVSSVEAPSPPPPTPTATAEVTPPIETAPPPSSSPAPVAPPRAPRPPPKRVDPNDVF